MRKKIKLSKIIISPIPPTSKGIVAFVSFIIDDIFQVRDVMIATSPSRGGQYRLVYPYKTLPNGAKVQVFYPLTKDIGIAIEKEVLDSYGSLLSNSVS